MTINTNNLRNLLTSNDVRGTMKDATIAVTTPEGEVLQVTIPVMDRNTDLVYETREGWQFVVGCWVSKDGSACACDPLFLKNESSRAATVGQPYKGYTYCNTPVTLREIVYKQKDTNYQGELVPYVEGGLMRVPVSYILGEMKNTSSTDVTKLRKISEVVGTEPMVGDVLSTDEVRTLFETADIRFHTDEYSLMWRVTLWGDITYRTWDDEDHEGILVEIETGKANPDYFVDREVKYYFMERTWRDWVDHGGWIKSACPVWHKWKRVNPHGYKRAASNGMDVAQFTELIAHNSNIDHVEYNGQGFWKAPQLMLKDLDRLTSREEFYVDNEPTNEPVNPDSDKNTCSGYSE